MKSYYYAAIMSLVKNIKERIIKMKTVLIKATEQDIEVLRNKSAFTFIGAGGNLNEWMVGVNDMLKQHLINQVSKFYTWNGKLMNDMYGLTGTNAYQDDITFLAFDITEIPTDQIGKLSMLKLAIGARWLDDIVNNDLVREQSGVIFN